VGTEKQEILIVQALMERMGPQEVSGDMGYKNH
jgi:hypothetical protein